MESDLAQWASAITGVDWTAFGSTFVEEAFNLSYLVLLIALCRYRPSDITLNHPKNGSLRLIAFLASLVGALTLAFSLFQLVSSGIIRYLNPPGWGKEMFEAVLRIVQRVCPYVAAFVVYRSIQSTPSKEVPI